MYFELFLRHIFAEVNEQGKNQKKKIKWNRIHNESSVL